MLKFLLLKFRLTLLGLLEFMLKEGVVVIKVFIGGNLKGFLTILEVCLEPKGISSIFHQGLPPFGLLISHQNIIKQRIAS
jgi:hypothetical protein